MYTSLMFSSMSYGDEKRRIFKMSVIPSKDGDVRVMTVDENQF